MLRGGRVLNVFSNEIVTADVLLAGRLIAAVGNELAADAETVVDVGGRHLAPGLIDGHLHLESSLVTPQNYARAVLPRGVTGVVCDPHELANVAGERGVRWLLAATDELPLDVYVTVPSCVPSTSLETAGAELSATAMERLLEHPRVVGVAEIMSFPAVVDGDGLTLSKVAMAESADLVAEGHAPGLSGPGLQAYVASGISSDHESTTLAEGLEKLRAGLFLMVREGSLARDLDALLPLIDPRHGERIGFVTDDKLPHDLLAEGGVDQLVRRAIAGGVDPVYAVRCASYNNALHYRLARRGALAPGYFADVLVIDDLKRFALSSVYKDGRLINGGGFGGAEEIASSDRRTADEAVTANEVIHATVRLTNLTASSFAIPARLAGPASGELKARCIGAVDSSILTRELLVTPKVIDGLVVADVDNDVLKLACVERHGRNGRVGMGLVNGFGLTAGALASSVGHDHHNIMVVGANDDDMLVACRRLAELGGGLVAVAGAEVRAELALPLAGLLTDAPLDEVAAELELLDDVARRLGSRLASPYMALSFMGLPVIPELKVTDHGLIDVHNGRVVDLIVAN